MTIEKWKTLTDEEQKRYCSAVIVNPYDNWVFFKEIESAFLEMYGKQSMILTANCSFGPGFGPYNTINVSIASGKGRSKLPKYFMGFPISKQYVKQE